MNKLLSTFFAIVLALGVGLSDADAAKRLGGGKSVGTQRQSTQQMQPQQSPQAAPQAAPQPGAAPAAAAGGKRWLGPVAGLLAGGLLGAMLFGHGFDGIKFMDILLVLLLAGGIFFIFRMMMMRKPQADQPRSEPMQYAGAGADPRGSTPSMPSYGAPPTPAAAPVSQPAGNYFPAGFDAEGFARQAKGNFMRMQEANDRGDSASLRDMMTPALFQEIQAQIHERGNAPQKTEVLTLDAKVIEVVTERDHYVASVRFTGMIKDDGAAQPESFSEIWHLEKPLDGKTGWLMSGIQQD